MTTVTKRGFISAKVVCDSISDATQTRITTFELEYPRFIHSEFMTHRQFSRNSASSRAIPIAAMHQHILEKPQAPIEWGRNQSGMQARELLPDDIQGLCETEWDNARYTAVAASQRLASLGAHKQIANRITEPFMQMKVVCTATQFSNWFWLRDHADAQPEIRELAVAMREALEASTPQTLQHGEWHVPYVDTVRDEKTGELLYVSNGVVLDWQDAVKVSASCCAQVSYRKNDTSLEKALAIYDRLIASEPVHASPVEHQATPIQIHDALELSWPEGVTHIDRAGQLWSGNFLNWIQFRQTIPNHDR